MTESCGGFVALPIGSGASPKVAVPIVDARGGLVKILSMDSMDETEIAEYTLSFLERGFACERGIDYVAADGGTVSMVWRGGVNGLDQGPVCHGPSRSGWVKELQCARTDWPQ